MNIRLFTVLAIAIIFVGCTTPLPVTSSLNDFVMMGTKANNSEEVSFTFKSMIKDSVIIPYTEGRVAPVQSHAGYTHTASAAFGRMLNDYMSSKFMKIAPNATVKLSLTLEDLWLEQYSTSSTGTMIAVAFVGGEIDMMCIAKVKLHVMLDQNGEIIEKIISTSAEDVFVSGVGTGTSTSNIHQGKNSIQHIHARNLNKAENKAIMMLNAFLEEAGL